MKRTRNTSLLRALGEDPAASEFRQAWYSEQPWLRQMHVSAAIQKHSPLRSRNWGGGFGYSRFQVTADGRSYTVLVLADGPEEWHPLGLHGFRNLTHDVAKKVEYHHVVAEMDKAREERAEQKVAAE